MRMLPLLLFCAGLAAAPRPGATGHVVITHMLPFQGRLVLVGRDDNQRVDFRSTAIIFIAKRDGLVERTRGFTAVREIGGRPIYEIDDLEETADGLLFWSDQEQYRLRGNRWTRQPLPLPQQQLPYWSEKLNLPADFSSDQFPPSLVRRDVLSVLGHRAVVCGYRRNWLSDHPAGVLMVEKQSKRFYRLPPLDLQELRKHRPQRYAAILDTLPKSARPPQPSLLHRATRIDVRIGAHARLGDTVWIATAFRDTDKTTGIGALAAFDLRSRSWRMEYVRELSDWSTSAMLAEEETLWIGLCRHLPEEVAPGGLLRYNLNNGSCDHNPLPARIYHIARLFGRLHLATENGLYVMTPAGTLHLDFGRFGALPRRDLIAAL